MRQDTTISGFTGSKTKDNRYLSKLSLPTNSISSNAEERTELDSHADTCIAGQNYVVQHFTGVTCEVYPYDKSYEPQVVKIVDAITAYDDAASVETYILVLNQALHMPNQEPSLFCPNQLRHNGLIVNECPTQWADPTMEHPHSIIFPNEDVIIPLEMNGIMSGFSTRKPTELEINNCTWLTLTSTQTWDPSSNEFEEQEERYENQANELIGKSAGRRVLCSTNRVLSAFSRDSQICSTLRECGNTLDDDAFLEGMLSSRRIVSTAASKTRHSTISPELLAKRWGCGQKTAERTLKVTTQKGIRSAVHPLHRRYSTKQQQLKYNRLDTTFYADTLFASQKSLRGNTMSNLFINDTQFMHIAHMDKKSQSHLTLTELCQEVGVPNRLHTDGAKELNLGKWGEKVRELEIKQTLSEPYSQFQNRAESGIRELKKKCGRIGKRMGVPKPLWDYLATYVAETHSRTAHPLWNLHGRTPYEITVGETPDISEWFEYEFYEPCWYLDNADFPDTKMKLGRWLGVAHRIGQAMVYYVIPKSGVPLARSTVQPFSDEDKRNPAVTAEVADLDKSINRILKKDDDLNWNGEIPNRLLDEDDEDGFEAVEPDSVMPDADDYDEETLDKWLSAKVLLPHGDTQSSATVRRRKRDHEGNPIGTSHPNPVLDTRVYEVEFEDGTQQEYAANLIATSIFAQVDDEGYEHILMDEIIEHKADGHAVKRDDMYIVGKNGNKHMRRTTKGWKLLVKWKDGSSDWLPLADLKESDPVQTAEYAVANQLENEPAFAWWVKETIKRRDRIISQVKTRYQKRTHKFGIEVPKNVAEALAIDKRNGNTLWEDSIKLEMKNVMPAFKFLEGDMPAPIAHKKIQCHMIFDIKMDFTRKARFVAGGHLTDPPASITYSSVVARDSVRIAFMIAALNDLSVLVADVGNAYLNAPCREKIWFTAGKEFGSRAGTKIVLVRALYGLKTSGAAWRAHISGNMRELGFEPSDADPDVWMRAATKLDGFKYYEYVLIYVDDILALGEHPEKVMISLSDIYRLKKDKKTGKAYAPPERYLGANIGQYDLPDSQQAWYMSSDDYVREAVKTVEQKLSEIGEQLVSARNSKISGPISPGYRPELDISPELGPEKANYYQNLIGVLRWAVELGRIDIHVEVALLSSHLAMPRKGHLDQVFHIFAYLKKYKSSKCVFDASNPSFEERFKPVEWEEFYPDAKEDIPHNMPTPRGNEVTINCFVDADHAGNQVTRRSHTGILIFLNRAPVSWFSKKQNTVESSTFGSEFVAMKTAAEQIMALRYKLRMFGIPIEGPANVFCDNEAVVTNSSIPTSTIKKKHLSICYHLVRSYCAAGGMRVTKENGKTNLSDILTKLMPGSQKRRLAGMFLYA
jgi:hypothetical protein